MRKVLRWVTPAVALLCVLACNERALVVPKPEPEASSHPFIRPVIHAADVLFLVDDSSSMTPIQANLARNFPAFIDALRMVEGGLPDVHIAVTTSSMGAGAFTSAPETGCGASDGGRFVYQPRAATDPACQTTKRITGPEHFIESLDGGTRNNFAAGVDIADVFTCIAQVGDSGCGFEHQLAAVRAALGDPAMGVSPAPGNQGFLRQDAYLAVVFITNEDDCSAPPDSLLFDPSNRALGPLESYRCTRFGLVCGASAPPAAPAAGPIAACTSNDAAAVEDPLHSLMPVSQFVDYFARIKGSRERLLLSAVAAPVPAEGIRVVADQQGGPCLAHSCGPTGVLCGTPTGDVTFGDPAIRLKQVIDSAGENGVFLSICQDSYRDAMERIGAKLAQRLGPPCLDRAPVGRDGTVVRAANGELVAPDRISCTVEDVVGLGTPDQSSRGSVPPCRLEGEPPGVSCWVAYGDATCAAGARIAVCRNGLDPAAAGHPCRMGGGAADTTAVVECATVP
jgi:hypothetical protein